MDELKRACEEYLEIVEGDRDGDRDDAQHYIFENAMELVFGKDIWTRVNIALSGGVKHWDGQ